MFMWPVCRSVVVLSVVLPSKTHKGIKEWYNSVHVLVAFASSDNARYEH
jgi:hypothetical protein